MYAGAVVIVHRFVVHAAVTAVAVAGAGCSDAGDPSDGEQPALTRPEPRVSACLTDPACDVPLVVAHRGIISEAPENSLLAIERAIDAGADLVEIDVRATTDGVLVLMHDATVSRTTDQPERFPQRAEVTSLTWPEVQTLVLEDTEGLCTSSTADDLRARCRVPSLRQALDAARGHGIVMIDWKDGEPEAVGRTVAEADATSFVLLFDGDQAKLAAARSAAPGLVTMPRARGTDEAVEMLRTVEMSILHVDAGYLSEIHAAAETASTKLFVDVFLEVDFLLFGYLEVGGEENLQAARVALYGVLDNGADVVQTNSARHLRPLVDEWRRRRPEPL